MVSEEEFENAWYLREEVVFRQVFGQSSGEIYTLSADVFGFFNRKSVDPRWLTHGVIKFPPNGFRQTWVYATSGLSNAWEDDVFDPDGLSGLGCEIVFETADDFDWALRLMRRLLAYQILLGWGHYEGGDPFAIGSRIPLGGSIDRESSELKYCLIVPPKGYEPKFQIPSGRAEFYHIVGVTEAEFQFARTNGMESLLTLLSPAGYPVTNPARASVV